MADPRNQKWRGGESQWTFFGYHGKIPLKLKRKNAKIQPGNPKRFGLWQAAADNALQADCGGSGIAAGSAQRPRYCGVDSGERDF